MRLLTRVSQAQDGLRKDGADWKVRCPAHTDRVSSLAVKEGREGQLLLHCHAGCKTEDVLRAWGVEWSVLFPEDPSRNGSRPAEPEKTYDYTDETGALLFQVCRFPGKQFRQRRPLPS